MTRLCAAQADGQTEDAGPGQDGCRVHAEHAQHHHDRTEIEDVLAQRMDQRYERPALLIGFAFLRVQLEGLVEHDLEQLDQHARAEEDADALDDARPEVGDDDDEVQFADAQRSGGDVHGRLETVLAEGEQPFDAVPVLGDDALVEMTVAQVGQSVRDGPRRQDQEPGDRHDRQHAHQEADDRVGQVAKTDDVAGTPQSSQADRGDGEPIKKREPMAQRFLVPLPADPNVA